MKTFAEIAVTAALVSIEALIAAAILMPSVIGRLADGVRCSVNPSHGSRARWSP